MHHSASLQQRSAASHPGIHYRVVKMNHGAAEETKRQAFTGS